MSVSAIESLANKITIAEAAKRLGVSLPTAWRYVLRGARGVKLASIAVGGRRYIPSPDALADFISATTAAANGESIPTTPAAVAKRRAKRRAAVNAECEAAGI